MSLETHFFTKQLQKYKNNYNKVDKNFASTLLDAVDAISQFLKDAQIQENDDKADIFEIIPSIDSEICQAHRYYYCKACNQSVRASPKAFNEHFYGNKHTKKLREVEQSIGSQGKSKKQALLDQQHKGSTQSLDSVKSSAQAKDTKPKKERLNSLPAGVSQPRNNCDNLPKGMREFLTASDLDSFVAKILSEGVQIMNCNAYKRVCDLLHRRLSSRFPEIKVYPFGSVVIGLGRPGGDLDIFIDIGDCYFEKPSKRKMKDAIHQTQGILMKSSGQWIDFEPVTKARTPILRVFCKHEKIDCDLSFSNGLSSCNTALIGYFINLQPVCKKLCAFVKFWASKLQAGLNSYLISLMVIFYLQQEQLLPPVELLQKMCEPVLIDGWHSNFAPIQLPQLKVPMATDFRRYLVGFFQFYGYTFDHEKHIISILTGTPIEKKLFDHGNEQQLPPTFERFKNYMATVDLDEADEVEDLFSNHKPLVIQDPFELCHNVSKGVQLPKLKKLVSFMRQSYEIVSQRTKF